MPSTQHPSITSAAFSNTQLNRIVTSEDVERLAGLIIDEGREEPVVVVTEATNGVSYLDANLLVGRLKGCAVVAEVAVANNLQWQLSWYLPNDAAVYNGAARVYPAPSKDELGEYRHLFCARDAREGERALAAIENDVMGLLATEYLSKPVPVEWQEVDVEVRQVGGSSGLTLCQMGSGMCPVRPDEVLGLPEERDLPHERVFASGMKLHGRLDPKSKMLVGFGDELRVSAVEALSVYEPGMTVLVKVTEVKRRFCRVAPFPGFYVRVDAEDVASGETSLDSVISVGQVLPALVVERGEAPADWLLSIAEADDEKIQPAPSLLKGGVAWLVPEDEETEPSERVDAVQVGDAGFASPDVPEDAGSVSKMVIEQMGAELAQRDRTIERLEKRLDESESALAVSKKKLFQAQRRGVVDRRKRYRRPRQQFLGADDQFEYERRQLDFLLYDEWVTRTMPGERGDTALPAEWRYDEDFFETMADVDVTLGKVLRCMVDVLTGRQNREAHPLRTSPGGGTPHREGPNGESLYRCYIEQRTAQAARLHYMVGEGGLVTFTSVRRHDDYDA